MTHIAVLGAGVVGVTTAWYLRQAGYDVTVIEREPAAGLQTSFANGGQISVSHATPWANPATPMKALKWLFKEDAHSSDLKTLHTIEWPIMAVEIMLIAMLFVSLLVGNEFQQTTTVAFQSGIYANLFWFGVMGVGFGLPLVLNFALGKHVAHSHAAFYLSGMASVVGVLCLRMFIIYAGQTFGV